MNDEPASGFARYSGGRSDFVPDVFKAVFEDSETRWYREATLSPLHAFGIGGEGFFCASTLELAAI